MAEGRVPVLYLAGLGRSGTTLIERTLAETPGVTGLGEVMHLWERGLGRNELCGCGVPFASCPFWREVGARAFGGWERVDAERMTWLKGQVDRASRVPAIATSLSARFAALVDGEDEEDRSGGQRAEHWLRSRHGPIVARPACGRGAEGFE